jgi:hypothetical protein
MVPNAFPFGFEFDEWCGEEGKMQGETLHIDVPDNRCLM